MVNSLETWDEATCDCLVLSIFSDERPLRGAAGLADWRLCGRLSRLLKSGKLRGKLGEALLMPSAQRMSFNRLLIFGLGPSSRFTEAVYRKSARTIIKAIEQAGIKSYAVHPPGRATGLIAARRAVELWLEESGLDSGPELSIIDAAGVKKEMSEVLVGRARRARQRSSL